MKLSRIELDDQGAAPFEFGHSKEQVEAQVIALGWDWREWTTKCSGSRDGEVFLGINFDQDDRAAYFEFSRYERTSALSVFALGVDVFRSSAQQVIARLREAVPGARIEFFEGGTSVKVFLPTFELRFWNGSEDLRLDDDDIFFESAGVALSDS